MNRADRPAFQGAIFDLDGLLVDSEPFWRWAQAIVLGEAGGSATDAMLCETTGLGLDEALRIWRGWFPGIRLDREETGSRLQALVLGRMAGEGRPKPGAREALEACRDAGCRMAVASSSTLPFIRAALSGSGMEGYFQALVTAHEVERGKPDPAVYLAAAGRLGLPPEECLAFEDSLHGLRAAKAAGMRCVAVPSGSRTGFEAADILLDSLEEFRPAMVRARV